MEIFYWSDYGCPYCYIGETNLKAALKELGIPVKAEMHAFELSPDASRSCLGSARDLVARKYGLSPERAEESLRRINDFAAASGLAFDFGKARFTNTFDAHRLTKYARSLDCDKADAVLELLFRAGFCLGRELADREVLLDIAREAGLEEDAVKAVLDSDAYAAEVRADEQEAHRYGVSGVPYFVINGEYAIPGALGKEEMKKVLLQIQSGELSG